MTPATIRSTTRQIGAAIGAALLPAIAGAVDRGGHTMASGDRVAMLTGALAAGLACAVALRGMVHISPRPRHG